MLNQEQNSENKRKYEWLGELVKMTGKQAKKVANVNSTYIVYEENGILVKEYPDGGKISITKDGDA